jgi:hypothetical protein
MTYDPTQPTDLPSPDVAVNQIRTNFSQYFNIFDNNHVAINANSQGKHSNVIIQGQIADPEINGNFDTLYSKSITSTSSTSEELFVKIPQFLPNHIPNDPMQLTFNVVNLVPQYQSFIPGGYIVYWDSIPSANVINTTVTLTPTPSEILCVIPNPTKLVGVGVLPTKPTQISVTILNASQFRINATFAGIPPGTGIINWIAIARQ